MGIYIFFFFPGNFNHFKMIINNQGDTKKMLEEHVV